jgi:signal transduction histidine kinase
VRDSIVGRVERHGGHVAIRSAPGEGTEVELAMERSRA